MNCLSLRVHMPNNWVLGVNNCSTSVKEVYDFNWVLGINTCSTSVKEVYDFCASGFLGFRSS